MPRSVLPLSPELESVFRLFDGLVFRLFCTVFAFVCVLSCLALSCLAFSFGLVDFAVRGDSIPRLVILLLSFVA